MDLADLPVAAPRAVTPIAVERILHRLCAVREGSAFAAGELRWAITLHGSIAFHETVHLDAGRVAEIVCDAQLDRFTPAQATIVARFHADVSAAFQRERVAFASFDDVRAFVYTAYKTAVRDGVCVLSIGDDEVTVRELVVEREPWLSIGCLFMAADEVSAGWLLAKSAELVHLGFAQQAGEIRVETALPLEAISAQRLIELIDDVLAQRTALYRAYERDAG